MTSFSPIAACILITSAAGCLATYILITSGAGWGGGGGSNLLLAEFERDIVSDLINDAVIKFYKRYVDDTLVLIKPSEISSVLAKFNSFVRNLNFTVDTFLDSLIQFLRLRCYSNVTLCKR